MNIILPNIHAPTVLLVDEELPEVTEQEAGFVLELV
jgi:hypothetical protein